MLVLVFVLGLTANAQDTIEKTTGEFSTVKVYDLINLKMIKSDENKVIITGEDVDDVEVIIKNNMLKIRMDIDRIFDGTKTFQKVCTFWVQNHTVILSGIAPTLFT